MKKWYPVLVLLGVVWHSSGCSERTVEEQIKRGTELEQPMCAPSPVFHEGIFVYYPMTSDTSFGWVVRSTNHNTCTLADNFLCGMPMVAVPRLVTHDSIWAFFENGSGNYTRHLNTVNLSDCTSRSNHLDELLAIDTKNDLIVLFERGSGVSHATSVRVEDYNANVLGRIVLNGMLCAEQLACVDSVWFTASAVHASYREQPDGPSLVAGLEMASH